MTEEKRYSVKEIEQMATDLTVKTPQPGDKIHNSALALLVERARLIAVKEGAERDLEDNNVVDIHKNRGKKK